MTAGKRHPKTQAIVLSYLAGKSHKEVSHLHGVPYSTCTDIAKRYISWVPVLKKPFRRKKKPDSAVPEEYGLPL